MSAEPLAAGIYDLEWFGNGQPRDPGTGRMVLVEVREAPCGPIKGELVGRLSVKVDDDECPYIAREIALHRNATDRHAVELMYGHIDDAFPRGPFKLPFFTARGIWGERVHVEPKPLDETVPVEFSNISKMRAASHALPDPGGEVVRACLDEIERLAKLLNDAVQTISVCKPPDPPTADPFPEPELVSEDEFVKIEDDDR